MLEHSAVRGRDTVHLEREAPMTEGQGNGVANGSGGEVSEREAMDVEAEDGRRSDASSTRGRANGDGSGSGLDREELVRVIAQAVRSMGYTESAATLEREAGVEAMSSEMRALRTCVLEGRWTELEEVLGRVDVFVTDDDARAARFVLYEQKFLELLELGRTADALRCLREQLTECSPSPKDLHRLPLLHMCQSADELRKRAGWPGAGLESRTRVLERLRKYIPTAHLLAENRLETLLGQAIELQKRAARYPYTRQTRVGLLEDLVHDADRMPRKPLHKLAGHGDEVWYVQFSHDGRWLASASKDKTVCIWDVGHIYGGGNAQGEALKWTLRGHNENVCFVSWSPDDTRLISCGSDDTILLWDMTSGQNIRSFRKHSKQAMACVWAPGGRRFYSGSSDKKLYEWDAETGDCVGSFPVTKEVMDLALTSDGNRLVCCLSNNTVEIWNTGTREREFELNESLYIMSCHLASDDRHLLVNLTSNATDEQKLTADSEIHIWDLETRSLQKKLSGFKQCRFVIRAAFGGYRQMFVICGSEDKLVHVWERQSGELLLTLEGHTSTVNSVHWSPVDPQLFASGSDDHLVILWGVDPELRGPAYHQVPQLAITR